ncbi:hypothetical protein LTS15_005177 [Exophiala xenobiotica]|nr:hypothetical protein LTS15_005177 [Exophiala xenobiotica]
MAEVIELLSSSSPPHSPLSVDHLHIRSKATTILPQFSCLPDGFDETGCIDFAIDPPSKRRRLSPDLPTASPPKKSRPRRSGPVYELLSEPSSLPDLAFNEGIYPESRPSAPQRKDDPLDEITWSSSAPELRHITTEKPTNHSRFEALEDSSDNAPDPVLSLSQPTAKDRKIEHYSHQTANLLAVLSQDPIDGVKNKSKPPRTTDSGVMKKGTSKNVLVDGIVHSSSPAKVPTAKDAKASGSNRAATGAERAAAKAEREAEKEAEKERKKVERERKAQEKQKAADLAEANKSRTNKKEAVPEMIVDMTTLLKDTSVGIQVEAYMKNLDVDVTYVDEEANLTDEHGSEQIQYGNLITWRRKVRSTYNDEDGQWEPTSRSRVVKEKHVLIHLPAVDFAAVVAVQSSAPGITESVTEAKMKSRLDAHVASVRQRFGNCIPVYLIEGLHSWLKRNANAKNRAYTAAVRAQMADADAQSASSTTSGSQAKSRKRKKPSADSLDLSSVTPDVVEDLLLHLQVAHQPILIHHTTSPSATASQISALTQHLATRPYRLAQLDFNLKSASFCMDSGQVRTGDDTRDTFVKMLQEVQRVTPSMAYGIVDKFESVRKLVEAFDRHGNLLLEDVRKSVNKDGAWSDKRLGPMVSKRLFKVFMGRDPSATDGMS